MYPSLPRGIAGALLVALAGCYDAPRTNPFDPALTPAVELLSVTVDNTSGSTTLEWTPYAGKQPFAEYRVLRQVRDRVTVDTLMKIPQVQQTTFRDTTLQPGVVYGYWVEVVNQGGFDVESEKHTEVVYALPSIELLEAKFSSDTATADLVWTQYRGPNFAAYEVRQKVSELEEKTVAEVDEVSDTTYTDTLLDGNTEYIYHIVVRTGWEGVGVSSKERSGKFYPFDHEIRLPDVPDAEPHAVSLAVDEQDGLYIAMTAISPPDPTQVNYRGMKKGLWVRFPSGEFNQFFNSVRPHLLSPIHMAAGQGRVYVSVQSEDGRTLVGALGVNGERWGPVEAGSDMPAGIYLEEDGTVVMLDTYYVIHRFSPEDGHPEKPAILLRELLFGYLPSPVEQVRVGPRTGKERGDQFFLLSPAQREHYLWVITRRPATKFSFDESSLLRIDKGIGSERGQLLAPIALAFDRQRTRLLVLEVQGRLQVFDARLNIEPRYITQWGRVGIEEGAFLVAVHVGVAMVVDSQGMVYVVDESRRIQVFAP